MQTTVTSNMESVGLTYTHNSRQERVDVMFHDKIAIVYARLAPIFQKGDISFVEGTLSRGDDGAHSIRFLWVDTTNPANIRRNREGRWIVVGACEFRKICI